jgi:hypothetical protein
MSNIRYKITITAASSAIAANIILILFLILLASISALNIPSFSQEENNNNTDDNNNNNNNHAIVLSGRVNSMLMPTIANTNNASMNNPATTMSQIIKNSSSTSTVNDTSAASQAMKFSMARDVAWLLSGDWVLAVDSNDNNTIKFDAEFIKVTTNGTMLHTHRITNFVPLTNISNIASVSDFNTHATTIMGKTDVYFNDQLVWPNADTTLTIMNGTVLMINIDSEDVDDHFHNQPIYGTVSILSQDDGSTITLPAPWTIQEKIEQELGELGANATQAQSAIGTRATEAERTFREEAANILNTSRIL